MVETKIVIGFKNLNEVIDQLENDPSVEDFTFEIESRGDSDETHEYFVQVIKYK
mgnify:CR=1 FL=1